MGTAVFLDLDEVVVAGRSPTPLPPAVSRSDAIARLIHGMFDDDRDRLEAHTFALGETIRGLAPTTAKRLIGKKATSFLSPLVFAEALEVIDRHRNASETVVLFTASPTEVGQVLAASLGLDLVIGSEWEIDPRGVCTGDLSSYPVGIDRMEMMLALAADRDWDLSRSHFYASSSSDIPSLSRVGYPIAVNPDSDLSQTAASRGWPILPFEATAPLRTRLQIMPHQFRVFPKGTAIAGAATAWMLWRALSKRKDR